MRKLIFKPIELSNLIKIIELGNSQYNFEFKKIGEGILEKINSENYEFTKKEIQVLKSYCSNWINNNEENIDTIFNKYWNKNINNYLNLDKSEIDIIDNIDAIFSIKSKLFLKKYQTFNRVFENIERMKKIDNIFISQSTDGKPYKIAFVDIPRKEILKFEINSMNNFEQKKFTKILDIKRESMSYLKMCNRKEAHEIFNKHSLKIEKENFMFFNSILN